MEGSGQEDDREDAISEAVSKVVELVDEVVSGEIPAVTEAVPETSDDEVVTADEPSDEIKPQNREKVEQAQMCSDPRKRDKKTDE